MAQASQLNDLAEGLISSVTGVSSKDANFGQLKTITVKGLRDHSHARTNQFDVKAKLDGLVEKFAVLDRDDLSDALQDRLNKLPSRDKLLPEVLSLLMLLSERPVLHTGIAVLDKHVDVGVEQESRTWADLIADDPASEQGLWDNVARGYHSSGDEAASDDDSEPTTSTTATSIDGLSAVDLARQLVIRSGAANEATLQALLSAQRISKSSEEEVITELSVVRQSLQMLRGLETDLYDITQAGTITMNRKLRTGTTAFSTMQDVLDSFSALGSSILSLRRWTFDRQDHAWQRTCQSCVSDAVSQFDAVVSDLELDLVGPSRTVTVSMIDVLHAVRTSAIHLCSLSQLVAKSVLDVTGSSYALLDGLYDLSCAAQLEGNEEGLLELSRILLSTLKTYLRPVTTWLRSGVVADLDDGFFVVASNMPCEPADIWGLKYRLRQDEQGELAAPRFLHSKLAEVFAIGKSTMFLKQLSKDDTMQATTAIGDTGDWDIGAMSSRIRDSPFTPYPHLFDEELTAWIEKTGKDCAPRLKSALLQDHGVLKMLTALNHIYLSADAVRTGTFADALFERIERSPGKWRDSFLITELARDTIGSGSRAVHAEAMTASVATNARTFTGVVAALESNITREKTSVGHVRALIVLLQTLYAQHCLRRSFTTLRPLSSQAEKLTIAHVLKLRQALIAFCDVFHTYITTTGDVLAGEVHARMLQSSGVDDMVEGYASYKIRLERALLLSPNVKPIRDAIVSIFALCEKFKTLWDMAANVNDEPGVASKRGGAQEIDEIEREYEASLSFATAGVRSLSRVGGEGMLEMLADRLEWLSG